MQDRPAGPHLAAPFFVPSPAPRDDWWLGPGDPVLASLITQGLSGSTPLACEAAGLVPKRRRGIAGLHRIRTDTAEAGYRYADHRARAAAAIAHAYVDVRKWQSLLALRVGVLAQYRDNAEIARFRREAGLVSAVDGGLAGALSAQGDAAQDQTRARLETAFVALSNLAGVPLDDLKLQLSAGADVPDLGPPPVLSSAAPPDMSARADLLALKSHLEHRLLRAKVSQAGLDQAIARPGHIEQESPAQTAVAKWHHAFAVAEVEIRAVAAAVAVADARLQTLPRQQAAAQRVVADARLAYRAGAGDFATLFVTEVAALGWREALVQANADRAGAMIDLRTARGEGWNPADLAPAAIAVAAAHRGADCE